MTAIVACQYCKKVAGCTCAGNPADVDGWRIHPRACPFDIADCPICPPATYETAGNDEAHLVRGDN